MKYDLFTLRQLILNPFVFQDMFIEVIDVGLDGHAYDWICENHKHPWYEFNYYESGKLSTTIDGTNFIASGGECILIPPGVYHENHCVSQEGFSGFYFRFYLNKAENYAGGCYDTISKVLKKPHTFPLKANVSSLFDNQSLLGVQASFLNWLFNTYEALDNEIKPVAVQQDSNISKQVILYLNEYYMNKIYVSDIAKAMNMSYRTLARIFKAETGFSIIEKLTEIRVHKAKHLLRTTDYTMFQIANEVGFENEYYFSKAFRKYSYTSPSSYKKEVLEK